MMRLWEAEISCKERAHSEKFRFEVKDEGEDFVSEEDNLSMVDEIYEYYHFSEK